MKKDLKQTKVIFRKFKDSGDIIALFPYDHWSGPNKPFCSSYMHIGQHSLADYTGCIQMSKPAKESEFKPLYQELQAIGYNLKIRQR